MTTYPMTFLVLKRHFDLFFLEFIFQKIIIQFSFFFIRFFLSCELNARHVDYLIKTYVRCGKICKHEKNVGNGSLFVIFHDPAQRFLTILIFLGKS